MNVRHYLFLMALAAPAVSGQTSAVPPSAAQPDYRETIQDAAAAVPGSLMQGEALINKHYGGTGSNAILRNADRVSDGISNALQAADLVGAARKDGLEGVVREGAQMFIDETVETAANGARQAAARFGVRMGLSATYASGGASLAFTGGTLIGGYIRDHTDAGRAFNNGANNLYFHLSPDLLKEAVSGYKYIDETSADWSAKLDADVQERVRQNRRAKFEQLQAENALQQRQQQAYSQQGQATAGTEPGAGSSLSAISAILNSVAQQHRVSTPLASAPRACTLDPKTGCHPGHDEKSHPGGCKAC